MKKARSKAGLQDGRFHDWTDRSVVNCEFCHTDISRSGSTEGEKIVEEKFSDIVSSIYADPFRMAAILRMIVGELDRMNAQWDNFAEWARIFGHPSWCHTRDRNSSCNCGLEEALVEIPREYISKLERKDD